MRKTLIIAVVLFSSAILHADVKLLTFTISAEVEKSSVIDLPRDFVRTYINDLSIYPRFFPDIVSVKKLNDKESEWHYDVKAPLSPTISLTFLLESKLSTPSLMVLESVNPEPDYLYCKAKFDSLSEASTKVTLQFKIRMTREHASDIHFLAGILGEDFISARMKDKLDGDMDTFIEKATEDMYNIYRKSH
jgi:uncharacterized membrane protein